MLQRPTQTNKYMDDDDLPELSESTKAVLAQFHSEQEAHKQKFENLNGEFDETTTVAGLDLRMSDFQEDWQKSQFWYDEETADFLARQLLRDWDRKTRIGLLAAPTAFVKLREIAQKDQGSAGLENVFLFEVDRRFRVFGSQFIEYDYTKPLRLPAQLAHSFPRLLLDPPFLNEDCHMKFAITARWLQPSDGHPQRLMVCTGERMTCLVERLYRVKPAAFLPSHANGLANEFRCFANFDAS
jgi:hypothetical protein